MPPSSRVTRPSTISVVWFCLGVVGRAADVRGEHDVPHRAERIVDVETLAGEVVEARAAEVAVGQRLREGGGVVQPGAGGVDVDRAFLHAGELLGADHLGRLGRDRRVHRHDVGLGEQVVERVGGVGCERVVADDLHAEAGEAPGRGPAHRAVAHDAHGLAGQLPGPEALVGDGAVAVGLARPDVEVGPDDTAVHREEEGDGHLGDGVGVASRRPQHGDALLGGGGDVDVVGVAAARADGDQRQVEHRALHAVGLDDEEVGALGFDPGGEVVGVVEAQRLVVDPGIEHDVGEGTEGVEAGTAERCGHERAVAVGHAGDSDSRDRFDPTLASTRALCDHGHSGSREMGRARD